MLDLDLVRTFVAVVEERSFTRAAERVHRTQSTVSQQIRRLEASLEVDLLRRTTAANQVVPTEAGERLLIYAQRLLSLAREAEDMVVRERPSGLVRLGLPEDFKSDLLTELIAGFASAYPKIRIDTVCGLTAEVEPLLHAEELDLALIKREAGEGPCLACWPEELVWVGRTETIRESDPVPLAVFPQGCLYRARIIHTMEAQDRRWRIAYSSASLTGILAAVSSGLAISLLAKSAITNDLNILNGRPGFPEVAPTELALVKHQSPSSPAARSLADYIITSWDRVFAELCAGHPHDDRSGVLTATADT